MQVSVEKMSSVKRRISITVPTNRVDAAYQQYVQKYAKTAKLPGFRPGKVPVAHVVKHYGANIKNESLTELMDQEIRAVLQEHQLMPVGELKLENQPSMAQDGYQFVVSFEVLPEMTDVQFALPQIEKLKVDISEEDINRVITQLQKQFATWEVIDSAAVDTNRLVFDYSYHLPDAEKPAELKDQTIELGSQKMLPGFEEGLLGAKAGDERTLSLSIPAKDKDSAETPAAPVEFKVKVKKVFQANVPEIKEELVKQLGIESGQVEDLQTQIRDTLANERDRLLGEKIKGQVFNHLYEQNALEVPETLVEREANRIHDEIHPDHTHHNHSEDEMKPLQDIAKKRVAIGLMMRQLVKQFDLKVDPEKIKQKLLQLAAPYESPDQIVEWFKNSPERMQGIHDQALEDLVVERLLQDVPVNEKNMSFAELKGLQNESDH